MRFLVEPRLLDHFGVAMYNTLEKAIAELAANGYDADASEVRITITPKKIVITDNGRGMTPDEV
jgi:DNA mismatch repair ATPase MutL